MKKTTLILCLVLLLAGAVFAGPYVKNELILQKDKDCYVEARHIVIKGTNEEIGKVLGDIAQKDYGVKNLAKYPDKIYAGAMDKYLLKNYPILNERAKGVAKSYNLKYAGSSFIFNQLVYDAGPWNGCSSVYYPPSYTTTKGGLLGHNMDYQLLSITKLLKIPGDAPNMFTRNYVVELYPDKGYSSIGVGTGDLLSLVSGMNEKGLIAVLQTDNYTIINTDPKTDVSGLVYPTQILRCVLDTCKTVEEAKTVILNNKISLTFEPAHLLIADTSGKSLIVEINSKNTRIELTENNGKPQPFTNHPLYLFNDPANYPKYTPFQEDSTFARYNNLLKLISQKKLFSPDDVLYNEGQVIARWNNPGRGQVRGIPNRTIWTDLFDQKNLTLNVKFYVKDGPIDQVTGDPVNLVYSKLFNFKLQK